MHDAQPQMVRGQNHSDFVSYVFINRRPNVTQAAVPGPVCMENECFASE